MAPKEMQNTPVSGRTRKVDLAWGTRFLDQNQFPSLPKHYLPNGTTFSLRLALLKNVKIILRIYKIESSLLTMKVYQQCMVLTW